MKISGIFALFTLGIVVKGWVANLQPIVLSLGAALAALKIDLDLISDIQPFAWKSEESEPILSEQDQVNKNLDDLIERTKR